MRTSAIRLHPTAISGFTAGILCEPVDESVQVWSLCLAVRRFYAIELLWVRPSLAIGKPVIIIGLNRLQSVLQVLEESVHD
jgi:hypothetical protein